MEIDGETVSAFLRVGLGEQFQELPQKKHHFEFKRTWRPVNPCLMSFFFLSLCVCFWVCVFVCIVRTLFFLLCVYVLYAFLPFFFFIPPHVCVYVFVCVEVVRSYVCLCVCVYSCVCMRSACLYLRMCLYLYCAFLCVCVCVYMCVSGFACVWLRRVFVCIVRSSRRDGSSRTARIARCESVTRILSAM